MFDNPRGGGNSEISYYRQIFLFVIKSVVSFYYKLFYLEELNYVFRQVY